VVVRRLRGLLQLGHPGCANWHRDPLGSGTSDTLGPCTNSLVLVTNLNPTVTVTFTDSVTGRSATQIETWSAPMGCI